MSDPTPSLSELDALDATAFAGRHIGPDADDLAAMLATLGCGSLAELVDVAVPETIRDRSDLALPAPVGEAAMLAELAALAAENRVVASLLGLGYHGTVTPGVIQRNVLENPAWYTAYTPYQP
jgi:glycine dehydrogenase